MAWFAPAAANVMSFRGLWITAYGNTLNCFVKEIISHRGQADRDRWKFDLRPIGLNSSLHACQLRRAR